MYMSDFLDELNSISSRDPVPSNTLNISNADVIPEMELDEIFVVNNRTITPPVNYPDIAVKGDNNSNSLKYRINLIFDGVDLRDKTIRFRYVNANNENGYSYAINKKIVGDWLYFEWLLDSKVTVETGVVRYEIEIIGDDYRWSSKIAEIKIEDSLGNTQSAQIITVSRGIDKIFQFNIYDNDGFYTFNEETDSLTFVVVENQVAVISYTVGNGISYDNDTFYVTISGDDTVNLQNSEYIFAIFLDSDGSHQVVSFGNLHLTDSIYDGTDMTIYGQIMGMELSNNLCAICNSLDYDTDKIAEVTSVDFELRDNIKIDVMFTYGVNGGTDFTLNINDTGKKLVSYNGTNYFSELPNERIIATRGIVTLMYDETSDHYTIIGTILGNGQSIIFSKDTPSKSADVWYQILNR